MRSMMQKREALTVQVVGLATAHGVDLNWTFRPRQEKLDATASRLDQIAIFGDPVRYLRISYIGSPDGDTVPESDASQFNFQAQVREAIHTFRLVLLYEYDDADTYEDSSQSDFDALTEGLGDPIGILPFYRRENDIDVNGEPCYLSKPSQVLFPTLPYPMDGHGDDYAHYMEFVLSITG